MARTENMGVFLAHRWLWLRRRGRGLAQVPPAFRSPGAPRFARKERVHFSLLLAAQHAVAVSAKVLGIESHHLGGKVCLPRVATFPISSSVLPLLAASNSDSLLGSICCRTGWASWRAASNMARSFCGCGILQIQQSREEIDSLLFAFHP